MTPAQYCKLSDAELCSAILANERAMDALVEFKCVSMAWALCPGLTYGEVKELSDRCAQVMDQLVELPPPVTAPLAEAAAAHKAMVATIAGITYNGGGEIPPAIAAEHLRCFGGG